MGYPPWQGLVGKSEQIQTLANRVAEGFLGKGGCYRKDGMLSKICAEWVTAAALVPAVARMARTIILACPEETVGLPVCGNRSLR